MEEYAGWLVYLWTVWGNIEIIVTISIISLIVALIIAIVMYFFVYDDDYYPEMGESAKNWINKLYKPLLALVLLNTFVPSKEQILLIMSATPTAKAITSSFEDGKIKKLDEILDLGLDRAIKKLKTE